ncbi:MAG: DUF6265 family protein [Acidobacteriota bacterium]|nr:DUF6265 family protein [Acidobacteriota bacterium]
MERRCQRRVAGLTTMFALTIVVQLSASPQETAKPDPGKPAESLLSTLHWLAGRWEGTEGEVRSEETWTAPAGGLMLGLHRDVRSNESAFFEYLRIVEVERGLVYMAQPLGRPATEFRLQEIGERHVVFENPEHDFPQRISYRRDLDETLVVRIEGESGGDTKSAEWRWSRLGE